MKVIPPETLVFDACKWIRDNPDSWTELKGICKKANEEQEPITRGNIYHLAKSQGITIANNPTFKRDHNLWSVLSRLLVMDNPSLTNSLEFRKTPVDDIDIHKYYESVVGEQLRAKTRLEARRIYRNECEN